MAERRVLYVTTDGLLQPLGHSQIVRVVEALARRGFAYDILSLERAADVERAGAVEKLSAQLSAAGVGWIRRPYDASGGAKAAGKNAARLVFETSRLAASRSYWLTHARAFHGGVSARAAKLAAGVPFLYDARSYWIDERLDEGRWFTNPAALALARALERRVFADAAAVVTLTELQADDVRQGKFGRPGGKPIVCIPTCADYSEFKPGKPAEFRNVPPELRARLEGKLVLGFIGSINRSYLMEESAALAARVLAARPDAFVLATSPQQKEYAELFARHGIPPERYHVQRVEHWAMPEWMTLVDWALLLLDSTPAKRASVPTKLAEFFAAGVRVVQYGCNPEVSEWVRKSGGGVVLDGVDPTALEAAAMLIAKGHVVDAEQMRARTEGHFSLASGVERYAQILERLRR
jgi:glycosyltransferase involved in cell wall biosynthesis